MWVFIIGNIGCKYWKLLVKVCLMSFFVWYFIDYLFEFCFCKEVIIVFGGLYVNFLLLMVSKYDKGRLMYVFFIFFVFLF